MRITRRGFCRDTLTAGLTLARASSAGDCLATAQAFGNRPTYLNPVLGGDHPDAGAIRVGNEFFLTHSSFDYAPGLPLWRSQDLVNWTLVGGALKRYYGSVWAPYLCEHEGHFYIYFPCNNQLHVVHTPNLLDAWSEPINLEVNAIDPAHIAANGRRYLHFNGGYMLELSSDGLSVKGPARKVFEPWPIPSDFRVECQCLEGPELFQRGEYFYLTVAEGGTAGPPTSHMVVSARSKSPAGPWTYSPFNPIAHSASSADRWMSIGHGRLVEAADGSWWMTAHAYENGFRGLGRQMLLLPIEWTPDGWFRVPAGISAQKPIAMLGTGTRQREPLNLSDEFTSPELSPHWQFWREFDRLRYRLPGKDWKRTQESAEVASINHNVLGGFLSLRPALYACGSGHAVFRAFRYASRLVI